MVEYILENGKIFLLVGDDRQLIRKVSIMYDRETGTLLKHGESKRVEEHYDIYVKAMYSVSPKMAEDVVIVTFDAGNINLECLVEFMNRSVHCTGNMNERIEKFLTELKEKR